MLSQWRADTSDLDKLHWFPDQKKFPKENWYLLFESLISTRLLTRTLSLSFPLSLPLFCGERPAHPDFLNSRASISPLIFPVLPLRSSFSCSYSKVKTEELRPAFRPWETTTFMHKYCKADHSVEKEPLRISRISNPALPDRKKTRETIANSFIRQRLLTLYPQATFTWRPVPVIWFKAQTE